MMNLVSIFQWSIILTIIHNHSCGQRASRFLSYEKISPQWYFSTLTTYNYVSQKKINVPTRTPIQLFMVIKHGTHQPYYDDNKMADYCRFQMRDKLKIPSDADMCPSDIEAINRWEPKRTTENAKGLVKNGQEEIIELAQRIRTAFPKIFNQKYNTDKYFVLSKPEQCCIETGEFFLKTIFKDQVIDTVPVCDKGDKILMIDYYKENCPSVKPKKNVERHSFDNGVYMNNTISRILNKIRRKPGREIMDNLLVASLYTTCAIERSYDENSIPPLCRVFCQEDLDVLEYYRDLIYYYDGGYGNEFSAKYSCPMAIRIDSFEKKIRGEGPKGLFYFGTSINILNLYVMLGLAKDHDPLMSSNYESMKNRKWRTSKMAPLAANFVAVLLKTELVSTTTYDVEFYFNEKLTTITLNDGTVCEKCPWSQIKDKFEKYIQDNSCTEYPYYFDPYAAFYSF